MEVSLSRQQEDVPQGIGASGFFGVGRTRTFEEGEREGRLRDAFIPMAPTPQPVRGGVPGGGRS